MTHCICCEGTRAVPHLDILLRCPRCSHVWADAELSVEQARALYGPGYFQGEEYLDYEREEPALRRNFRRCLRSLRQLEPGGGRVWEIGAAYGYFLDEASTHYQVAGCDISESATARARERFGLDVQALDYLDHHLDHPQDAICLWDCIEHLAEPHRFLDKAWRDLAPGGTLGLSTGDIGALNARLRGRNWRLVHVPTHLHYFTVRSITTLLERLGFQLVLVEHPPFWRMADAVAYQLLQQGKGPTRQRIYGGLKRLGVLDVPFPLNTLDLMTVWARKGPRRHT